jgi:hypothetical protein
VTIGDFATARADGTFRLAYLVRNTIANLTTQDAQVECFRNAAAHLESAERLEASALHRLEQEPRVGLGEDAGGLVRVGLIRAGGKLGLAVGRSRVG